MKIYISTPIAHIEHSLIERRITEAREYIIAQGHEAISPFDINPDQDRTYGYMMGKDIEEIIDNCNAVFFTQGFRFSGGCMIEQYVAAISHKLCYYEYDDIPRNGTPRP